MLVSCIMPTQNRRTFIPAAIQCFLDQTYEDRELVIIDDGDDRVADLIPVDPRIRYAAIPNRVSTGLKRNLCCEAARGEIICHTDDDDWSAPGRMADQVERLISTGRPITGYGTLLFWDVLKLQAKKYKASVRNYICGTTFCYRRDFWQMHQFKDQQVASDNAFIYPILARVAASSETQMMVARIHDSHTSSKNGIVEIVPREMIPAAFWDNEKCRQAISEARHFASDDSSRRHPDHSADCSLQDEVRRFQ
jgi:glycosyltransferase involved in cell wall biosynthesis